MIRYPSESNLAAGYQNEALLSHQQPEASENYAKNDNPIDVDVEHHTHTAPHTTEKTPRIDNIHERAAQGEFLSRSAKVEMLQSDTEMSPMFCDPQGAREVDLPPVSEVRQNFPFNPSPVTQPSFLSTEESADNQLMVSAVNAEYAQAQSGVFLSVPVSRASAASLTFNLEEMMGMIVMVNWALFMMQLLMKKSSVMMMMTQYFLWVLLFLLR